MDRYSRPVYFYETDKMAIVHNANYLRIFEEARLHLMEQAGVSYPEVERGGVLIPQTEAHINYKNTLRYGDTFFVQVKLVFYNGIRMKLEYEIRRKGDEKLIATGYTGHCFVDENTHIPLNFRKKMPEESALMDQLLLESGKQD